MKTLHMAAFLLVVIGALNWGLVGLFKWNLVMWLLGSYPVAVQVVYVLVGLSGLWLLVTHRGDCKVCGTMK